jgi:hypothetical protein
VNPPEWRQPNKIGPFIGSAINPWHGPLRVAYEVVISDFTFEVVSTVNGR